MDTTFAEACLARAHSFRSLDDTGRQRLAAVAVAGRVGAGETVIRQGDPSDAFYLLIRGLLRVEAAELESHDNRVAMIEPGTVFGEIGVLNKDVRSASVIAETEAHLLRFGRLGVAQVLKDYPKVLAELHQLGVDRSQDLLGRMLD